MQYTTIYRRISYVRVSRGLTIAYKILDKIEVSCSKGAFVLQWVLAHIGLTASEEALWLAKKALI